jgi:F0F1-type ATP synthase epsilon subunit
MSTFSLKILSPEGSVLETDARHLQVTAFNGSLGVLAHHAKMISAVVAGPGKVEMDGKTVWYAFGEGTLEVRETEVVLLVDFAEEATSLEDARNRVEEALA